MIDKTDDNATDIDALGLLCPLPVLRLRKVLMGLAPGAVVRLRATDGAAWVDVPHFCAETGHELLEAREEGQIKVFTIRHGG
ncbi:sulfurtransferase TusA family protein [Phaeovulum sp.]|uniref:sulfurtransferase TusA family protein n=1 Tax=Phaeovulum sp. TaxID=2934796 RepID=UPI0039E2E369